LVKKAKPFPSGEFPSNPIKSKKAASSKEEEEEEEEGMKNLGHCIVLFY
jgi:hypothetical protein